MPHVRGPPTPASSTDIKARDHSSLGDMTSTLILPPAAVDSASETRNTAKGNSNLKSVDGQRSPPLSPEAKATVSKPQRKRTLSGSAKLKSGGSTMASAAIIATALNNDNYDLPPPPSRARKIIQMKPKQSPNLTAQDQQATAPSSAKASAAASEPASLQSSTKKAKSRPSATSAAGRKIARKTAHSIIERRRRSKMNEEFGVLKDMIPACHGVEMHKLAILQAGIEYVRYLEGCIAKLKDHNEHLENWTDDRPKTKRDDDMDVDDETEQENLGLSRASSISRTEDSIVSRAPPALQVQTRQHYAQDARSSPSIANTSANNSAFASPSLRPIGSSASAYSASRRPSQAQAYTTLPPLQMYHRLSQPQAINGDDRSVPPSPLTFQPSSATAPSQTSTRTNNTPTATPYGTLATGISPAIHAFHFSPDITRTSDYYLSTPGTSSSAFAAATGAAGHAVLEHGRHSPHIAPLPQAALPLPSSSFLATSDAAGEKPGHAEVTATTALLMMGHDRRASAAHPSSRNMREDTRDNSGRKGSKGMSVRDLLSS